MYLLGLGEFGLDNFEKGLQGLEICWILFIIATLITNVIFLNVLIAIISDVYARITEGRERYGLM